MCFFLEGEFLAEIGGKSILIKGGNGAEFRPQNGQTVILVEVVHFMNNTVKTFTRLVKRINKLSLNSLRNC